MLWALAAAALYSGVCFGLARWYVSHRDSRVPFSVPGFVSLDVPGPDGPVACRVSWGIERVRSVFVLAHGYGGSQHSWQEVAAALVARGHGVVVVAMRGHGESHFRQVGFGPGESRDLVAVARWVRERAPDAKVIGAGISLGAASTWLATELQPDALDAVWSEGSFANLKEASDSWYSLLVPGGNWLLSPVSWFARIMTGVNPGTVRPWVAASRWKGRPCTVVHAEHDRLIGLSHAERIAAAAGCELWTVEDASHAQCKRADLAQYVDRLEALAGFAFVTPSQEGTTGLGDAVE